MYWSWISAGGTTYTGTYMGAGGQLGTGPGTGMTGTEHGTVTTGPGTGMTLTGHGTIGTGTGTGMTGTGPGTEITLTGTGTGMIQGQGESRTDAM